MPEREDFKAFTALSNAHRRFLATMQHMPEDITSSVVFEVPGEMDARRAVQAVKEGRAQIVERDHWADMQRAADDAVTEWLRQEGDADDQ